MLDCLLSTCGNGINANISGGGRLSNGGVCESWNREGNVSNGGVCDIINLGNGGLLKVVF